MTTPSTPSSAPEAKKAGPRPWRVVDIVIAAVLGVATGLLFLVWNFVGGAWYEALSAITPGIAGLAAGTWLIGGVLGGLIIRKPGAALFVELLAATVSSLLGSQWGIETVYSGLAQGLGAELIFALFMYRRFQLPFAMLAGAGAGAAAWVLELFLTPNFPKGAEFLSIYLCSLVVSGALLAGVAGWLLTRALAATGVLDRFPVGRERRR